ncbi:hypothetical protein QQF64_014162 [Cirrhinus molitorella]|uniref:Uncharacterized protein n=1 Tax=Cirrhinus molitorella TaxID=172907 RepID=A0ABR3LT74_9TELE
MSLFPPSGNVGYLCNLDVPPQSFTTTLHGNHPMEIQRPHYVEAKCWQASVPRQMGSTRNLPDTQGGPVVSGPRRVAWSSRRGVETMTRNT